MFLITHYTADVALIATIGLIIWVSYAGHTWRPLDAKVKNK